MVTWTYRGDDTDHSTFHILCVYGWRKKKPIRLFNCFCLSLPFRSAKPQNYLAKDEYKLTWSSKKTDIKEVFTQQAGHLRFLRGTERVQGLVKNIRNANREEKYLGGPDRGWGWAKKYKYKYKIQTHTKCGHSCAPGLGSDRYKHKCKIQIQIQIEIQDANTHKYTCRKQTQNVVPVVLLVWVPNNCYSYVVTFFFTEICFRSYRCFSCCIAYHWERQANFFHCYQRCELCQWFWSWLVMLGLVGHIQVMIGEDKARGGRLCEGQWNIAGRSRLLRRIVKLGDKMDHTGDKMGTKWVTQER